MLCVFPFAGQTKDNSLIQDTLVAALTHGGSKEELQALQQHLKAEIEHLEKTGLRSERTVCNGQRAVKNLYKFR